MGVTSDRAPASACSQVESWGVSYSYLGSKGWALVLPAQSVIGEGPSQGAPAHTRERVGKAAPEARSRPWKRSARVERAQG